ncbi:MAG: IS1595 family transposase [bacterium]|nr:IS1595 family transposase [Elusimicrobiota bacterium]
MENYPRNIMDFEKRFNSEEACREYLFKIKWPEGFKCPRCSNNKAWLTNDCLYKCSKCGFKSSVTAGTIFQDTRKPLQLWFKAMWYITNQKHGISALGLQRFLGIGSYQTAWEWLHRLRHAMIRPGRDRISGIIEVDETYIGGKKTGKKGRGSEGKILVVIAAQIDGKRIGRIRFKRIPDASGDSLIPAIKETIEPGSTVITDGWKGYSKLETFGYTHKITKKEGFVGKNLLPKCNTVAALLKRGLLGTHQGRVQYLDYYLDEFTFRFNRRTSKFRGMLFYRLVQNCVAVNPIHGKNLV